MRRVMVVVALSKRRRILILTLVFGCLLCLFGLTLELEGRGDAPAITPISRGPQNRRRVSLMFNVDWGEEHIPSILEALDGKHVKATFFLTASWAQDHPDLAKAIADWGHEVGNHGASHIRVAEMSNEALKEFILSAEATLRSVIGAEPEKIFAPPYGEWSPLTVAYAAEIGYKTILWTVDPIDWKLPPPETILARVLSESGPGALVLLHPTEPTSEVLAEIIDGLREKGLTLVTVTENLAPLDH